MSLLDRGREVVTVYQEQEWIDADGNMMLRPSSVGVTTRAAVQRQSQSGTSARRSEQDNEGFETEELYRLRLPRNFPFILGAQSSVEWRGERWSVAGEAQFYNGSDRTAHIDYTIKRT